MFQIKNITVLTRKKKFLLKEMVYSFYFHHHKHFEKNSFKVLFNFKYIKWDFSFTAMICFGSKYFRNLSFKFQMIFRLRIQIKLKSDR